MSGLSSGMGRTYHAAGANARTCVTPGCMQQGPARVLSRVVGLRGAVIVVMMCVMGVAMVHVLGAGKRRGSEHHYQQGSGNDFLHGSNVAPIRMRGTDACRE